MFARGRLNTTCGFTPLDNGQEYSMGKNIGNCGNQNVPGVICGNKRCLTGFTLIEAVIAIGVVGFVVLALVGLAIQCLYLTEISRAKTIAANHASAILEEMRNRSYDSLSSVASQDWETWANANGCDTLEQELITTEYRDINNITLTAAQAASADPLKVAVTVNWAMKTRTYLVRLSTVMTRR